MRTHYNSFPETANAFINTHQPKEVKKSCCQCPSAPLVFRFFLRNSIPLLLGLASGIGFKWVHLTINAPDHIIVQSDNNTLLEVSDIISSAVTLMMAYTMDVLLNCCWPSNPYASNQLFQSPSTSENTHSALFVDDQTALNLT